MSDETFFVFLRAVNLGKRNKVPMKELQAAIAQQGLGDSRFLLQSGNLIFPRRELEFSELKDGLERLIAARFNVDTVAFVRTPDELKALLDANPFFAPEGGSIQISLWDEAADSAGLTDLASRDWGADELHLLDRAAIMRFASSSHSSKLGNGTIEKKLKIPSTARNIRTFERLLASGD